jgi:monoamine oxidase
MRPANSDFDVVIVGGGAAGIGAARHLASSGLSTLLLEAGPRLGGRAWTQEIAGLPLDLGCGWMHSAEKNAWVGIANDAGILIDQSRAAWGTQYRNLGFTPAEQSAAHQNFDHWMRHLVQVCKTTDRASDALDPKNPWNNYLRAIVGFISGGDLDAMSATDYLAYDEASTESNWRSPSGLGALIAGSFPAGVALRLATPVQAIGLEGAGVTVTTPRGTLRARAALLTVSTAVLAGESITLPVQLDPWREAAKLLPLGHNEKLFLEIIGDVPFEKESQVLGNPRATCTGSYYLRPLDLPVVECFLGGESARRRHGRGLRLRTRPVERAVRRGHPGKVAPAAGLGLGTHHARRRRLQLRRARAHRRAPRAGTTLRAAAVLCRRSDARQRVLHRARRA